MWLPSPSVLGVNDAYSASVQQLHLHHLACQLQSCHRPAHLPRVSNMPTAILARISGSSLLVATPRRVSASEMLRVSPSVRAMIRVARASLSLSGSCLLCP